LEPNGLIAIAFMIVGAVAIRPDIALQVIGLVLIALSPFGGVTRGLTGDISFWSAFTAGAALIGAGRIIYHLRDVSRLMRAANPEVAKAHPQKRLGF